MWNSFLVSTELHQRDIQSKSPRIPGLSFCPSSPFATWGFFNFIYRLEVHVYVHFLFLHRIAPLHLTPPFSNDTWNTGCIDQISGNCNLYATRLTFCRILKGPTYLRYSFFGTCRNFICFVPSNTKSPSWNSIALRELSICCIICWRAWFNCYFAAWKSVCI